MKTQQASVRMEAFLPNQTTHEYSSRTLLLGQPVWNMEVKLELRVYT